jgi:Putative polyhydroxyalkanoic acid system protein (PHA_gran_rgn)
MPETLTVLIPHQLGRDEALRRLKSGIEKAESQFSSVFTVQEQIWSDNRLRFVVRALRQPVRGSIEVEDVQVKLEVQLPWVIARLAATIQQVVQKQGTGLLEKK